MKKLFVGTCLMAFCFLIKAQNIAGEKSKQNPQQKLEALNGTYELKFSGRTMSLLPSNLAEIIELNRKENENNTIRLNENAEVVIYPRNKIANNSPKSKE